VSCAKDRWTNINDLYASYDVLFCARSCFLEVAMIAPALKFLVASVLIFKVMINYLMQ